MSEQLISTPSEFGENGNFLLERELGAGGMGGVYMGRDKMLDRPVAVKVMLKEYGSDPEFVEKFKKEAQAAARLIHPNIAQIYSYGISCGMPYITMELVTGGSLYSLITSNPGKTDIQRVLKICQQTAMALQCATDQGVVHGDVKPENILLDANGNAKLVDFGLAAMQKDTNEIWGTPYYISPEKVKKEAVDFRADMYSLGGTLYHALTGVAPFEGDDSIAVVKKRFEAPPRTPSSIRPEITPAVDNLVMTMLELNKEDRYPSFEALLQAFRDVLTTGLTQRIGVSGGGAGGTRRITARTRRVVRPGVSMKPPAAVDDDEAKADGEEESEEGGNLGVKVALFVVGGLLAIGAVVGGLIWFKVSSEKSREAEIARTIGANCEKARAAIRTIREHAVTFESDCKAMSEKAAKRSEDVMGELKKLLPQYESSMKPEISAELKSAMALAAGAVATAGPAAIVTNAQLAATAAKALEKAGAAKEAVKDIPMAITAMQELWNRAYECQASQLKVSAAVKGVLAACDGANAMSESTEANMKALGDLSISVKDKFDQVKTSSDVDVIRKAGPFIESKGKKIIEDTKREIKIQQNEAKRNENKKKRDEEEERIRIEAEAAKKALIEKEVSSIAKKFDDIVEQGSIRQLDWKTATRLLKAESDSFKTAEGGLAAKLQLDKVNCMKKMQDLFVSKLSGYAFRSSKLKGAKVVDVDEKDIHLQRADKKPLRIPWPKFYSEYPGNLNEIINHFIVGARKNANASLSLKDWSEVMSGAALTMRLVCSGVNHAAERAESLAKEVVKQYSDYANKMKEMFPDIEFPESTDE